MWSGTLPRPMQRSGHWLRGPQTLRHRPPFPGLLYGPGWQPALPGQLCPQTSCPGQPMGSPGGGWEGRRREGSGCFLVFSALASHDCRVCRVHPAHKLGLPASPAASSHLCENLRRHLSFLHGILLTATTPAGRDQRPPSGRLGDWRPRSYPGPPPWGTAGSDLLPAPHPPEPPSPGPSPFWVEGGLPHPSRPPRGGDREQDKRRGRERGQRERHLA